MASWAILEPFSAGFLGDLYGFELPTVSVVLPAVVAERSFAVPAVLVVGGEAGTASTEFREGASHQSTQPALFFFGGATHGGVFGER